MTLVFANLVAYPDVHVLVLLSPMCKRFRESARGGWKRNVNKFAEKLTTRYREREEEDLPFAERHRRRAERERLEYEARPKEPRAPKPTYFTQIPLKSCTQHFPPGKTRLLEVCDGSAGWNWIATVSDCQF